MKLFFTFFFIVFIISSCKVISYTPEKEVAFKTSRKEAQNYFESFIKTKWTGRGKLNCIMQIGPEVALIFASIESLPDQINIKYTNKYEPNKGLESVYNLNLTSLEIPNKLRNTTEGCFGYELIIKADSYKKLYFYEKLDTIKKVIDALYVLKYKDLKTDIDQETEKFKLIADKYKSLKNKPEISKELKDFLVQSKNKTEEKKHQEATQLIEKALLIDQSYPESRFNYSLLLNQLENNNEAIIEMKKYIMLISDFPVNTIENNWQKVYNKYLEIKHEQMELDLKQFKIIAENYTKLESKPEISEEARKLMVQANSASEDKRYKDAIALLEQVISLDPLIPKAYFNKAMLLSEEKNYKEAIFSMKKYLLLVPNASNARGAQDKIYEWEIK